MKDLKLFKDIPGELFTVLPRNDLRKQLKCSTEKKINIDYAERSYNR